MSFLVFRSGWRVFLGAILLLVVSYLVYLLRYPLWWLFTYVEQLFVMLIASYSVVLIFALFLLKKDSKKSLSTVFKNGSISMIIVGIFFGLVSLGLWYLISFLLGSRFEFTSSTILRDYETYTFYSLPLAFSLYLGFSVFGAFAEEVAYRGYVQTRISSRYGYIVGILVSALFFSLQHIHVFELSWMERFFQNQFIHVFFGGVFISYLYFKTKENIWSVFAFHAVGNIFSVSVPVVVITALPFANQLTEIASFTVMILLLRLSKL